MVARGLERRGCTSGGGTKRDGFREDETLSSEKRVTISEVVIGGTAFYYDKGIVYVYKWDGLAWNPKGEEILGEGFGWSVSISPDALTFATGAPYYDGDAGAFVGSAQVYK